jgi:amylosucrase
VYNYSLHQQINSILGENEFDIEHTDNSFYARFIANAETMLSLYKSLYSHHPKNEEIFLQLLQTITNAYRGRSSVLKQKDKQKEKKGHWFLSNDITGMSLYVDRFCGNLQNLEGKLGYLKELGVNLLHLMPIFKSPEGESDGGYAVSDFRKVDERFGTLEDLEKIQEKMSGEEMYLMIDIVLNHTSHRHPWALLAKQGDKKYQDYYYLYDDRAIPDAFDQTMPDIFPESSPGNFIYSEECRKWVMTVFHHYQWDLNYTNPYVFIEMLNNIFFYANLGVDILRIDAPAFIWKQLGTTSQNLPEAHTILRLIKQCVWVAAPGMALLGEAIVAPAAIMKYFGTGEYAAKECDLAYGATNMALQWDALATGDTKIMLAAQHEVLKKPYGTSWITYTRCHDDIGLGYEDYMIEQAGYNAYQHRKFLKEYYSGIDDRSPARGALFSVNPKTQDARISGSLASLCGLEKALEENNEYDVTLSIKKIILMQAHSFFIGGIPMIFYGDELGYTNDYSYLKDPGKSYDNRWMHRPLIDWKKNKKIEMTGTTEQIIFSATKELIHTRKKMAVIADQNNITWLTPHNIHVAGFLRSGNKQRIYCLFNFSDQNAFVIWFVFKEHGFVPSKLYDHHGKKHYTVGEDHEYLVMEPYTFLLLEAEV